MASNGTTIKVGVFETTQSVPHELQGATLYYSTNQTVPEDKRFRVLDVNNALVNKSDGTPFEFGLDNFEKLASRNLIVFLPGIQDFMDEELARYRNNHDSQSDYTPPPMMEAPTPASGQQPTQEQFNALSEIENADDVLKVKDPTKHIGAFFVTIFLIAIVIICIRLFAPMLIAGVQGLLQ